MLGVDARHAMSLALFELLVTLRIFGDVAPIDPS
jgi:hypothetical protein